MSADEYEPLNPDTLKELITFQAMSTYFSILYNMIVERQNIFDSVIMPFMSLFIMASGTVLDPDKVKSVIFMQASIINQIKLLN